MYPLLTQALGAALWIRVQHKTLHLESSRENAEEGSGPFFTAIHPLSTLPSPLGHRKTTMGYILTHSSSGLWLGSDNERLWQIRGQERVRLGYLSVHLFPSLHCHFRLAVPLSLHVPVTILQTSLGSRSGHSLASTSPSHGTIPYGSPTPTPLHIDPPLNVLLSVSHWFLAEM